jgi:molecular chaperone GrpE
MEEELTNNLELQASEAENIEAIKKALDEEKAKAENYLANWQRAQADYINFKRRSEQEKEEIIKLANATLMLSLLPVLDDFERALNSIIPEQAEINWLEGIKLIERKLRTNLETQGLSIIETVGKPFDPRLHEAVRQVEGREGIVIEEVQKGYKLYDRVIRPSKVVVGNGEGEKPSE